MVRVIELVAEKADFNGQTINAANGKEVFIKEVVQSFYKLFYKPINYRFSGEGRKGDPNNWVADIEKLKGFDYQQQYSMEQGLENYYQWILRSENDNK